MRMDLQRQRSNAGTDRRHQGASTLGCQQACGVLYVEAIHMRRGGDLGGECCVESVVMDGADRICQAGYDFLASFFMYEPRRAH